MITKEHEYIPEDATDESHNAVGIGNPTNRTVHFAVAIVGSADSHTSLEFTHMTMSQRAAGECKLVKKKLLQSIGQPFLRKHSVADRFQLKNKDVVAIDPFRTRPTECRTIAGPHSETSMETRAVKRIAGKDGKDPEKVPPTIPLAANYMQAIRQPEQLLNSTCMN